MSRIQHASEEAQAEVSSELQMIAAAMGFAPNSLKLMAHRPAMVRGFAAMATAMLGAEACLDPGLRQMIAHVSSAAAGCSYCQAHTGHGAERTGLSTAKIEALWGDRQGPEFTDAERAALALAEAASCVPNEAGDAHFEALQAHYSTKDITEIVGVIAMFGFLNRWNDTLATFLEEEPRGFAEEYLAEKGWTLGAHG